MNKERNVANMVELLRVRAVDCPDRVAYRYLGSKGETLESITYAQLLKNACSISQVLRDRISETDRVLLMYHSSIDFINGLFACFISGSIGVPVYPPRNNRKFDRILSIVTDSTPKVCLTTRVIAIRSKRLFRDLAPGVQLTWLTNEEAVGIGGETGESGAGKVNRDDVAILQYTSGSTANPRGVMVSHGNFIHNLTCSCKRWELNDASVFVSWLPYFHDMGLVAGILLPIYGGFPGILMSPNTFLQRPFMWLDAISRFRGTATIAPNFAYDSCIDKISSEQLATLDLSCLAHAINGAEPVRWDTLSRFFDKFKECGLTKSALNPGYGLAEATLVVSAGDARAVYRQKTISKAGLERDRVIGDIGPDSSDAYRIVGCGRPLSEQDVLIVDPKTSELLSSSEIGEIWISSAGVAAGYWNNPELTAETFAATLAGREGPRYLRTGDLGFIDDGELYVTGRLKDVIIYHGVNHYPQDIERTVHDIHPQFVAAGGAAFSIAGGEGEQLVLLQEIQRRADIPFADVVQEIRTMICDVHGINPSVIALVAPVSLPKTSSGKIQRQECRRMFMKNQLKIVHIWRHQPASEDVAEGVTRGRAKARAHGSTVSDGSTAIARDDFVSWLLQHIANLKRIDHAEVNPSLSFSRFGFDSVQLVALTGDMEARLNRSLSASLLYDYPTPKAVADYLFKRHSQSFERDDSGTCSGNAIAIVGIGCRFPGSNGPDEFWNLLMNGRDAISRRGYDRRRFESTSALPTGTKDSDAILWGGFIDDIDLFDAQFFEISPREARAMDPQQRILLETAWEAIENAGITVEWLARKQTGIFIGASSFDYGLMQLQNSEIDAYGATGISHSILANRLSYFLSLTGPSVSIDTACSSSLVAIHLACRSLQQGECSCALAGGVNLIITPHISRSLARANMLSPDGRCRTFDRRANGYVRGEGCGVVVLKPVADAIRENDRIYAVIAASATNQDGRSNGLTAPSGPAQEAVVTAALRNAGIDPGAVSYVECHGTGTPLGDPQEVSALSRVLKVNRTAEQCCLIGSVKTNIGHLEAAAGVAGLIKVALCLHHRRIPKNLHFQSLNPHISLTDTPFRIPVECEKWPNDSADLVAGVSSFGFGGTNAHVILQDFRSENFLVEQENSVSNESTFSDSESPKIDDDEDCEYEIFTLSAKTPSALDHLIASTGAHLRNLSTGNFRDICYSANACRSPMPWRLACMAENTNELTRKLERISQGENVEDVRLSPVAAPSGRRRLVFVFADSPAPETSSPGPPRGPSTLFRAHLNRCRQIVCDHGLQIAGVPSNGQSTDADGCGDFTRNWLSLFTQHYALGMTFRSLGLEPDLIVGVGVGEVPAACIAGIMTIDESIRLISGIGERVKKYEEPGVSLAIGADVHAIEKVTHEWADKICIREMDDDRPLTTIIVERTVINEVTARLRGAQINVSMQGSRMAVFPGQLTNFMDSIQSMRITLAISAHMLPYWSLTSLREFDARETGVPENWLSFLWTPVNVRLLRNKIRTVEMCHCLSFGPRQYLTQNDDQAKTNPDKTTLSCLNIDAGNSTSFNRALATCFSAGFDIDWKEYYSRCRVHKVVLPTYPFQRQRYWIVEPEGANDGGDRTRASAQAWIDEVGRSAAKRYDDMQLDRYREIVEDLNELSFLYMVRAFEQLGIFDRMQEGCSLNHLTSEHAIRPIYRLIIERALSRFNDRRLVDVDRELYRITNKSSVECIEKLSGFKPTYCDDAGVLYEFVRKFGDSLPHILTGKMNPLEILFPRGSLKFGEQLYQLSLLARFYNGIIGDVVAARLAGLDSSWKLKILEVGAGTGATTASVLPLLKTDATEYYFTDVSDIFLLQAKTKFAKFSFLRYCRLDIEKREEFSDVDGIGEFDIVIAANVVHAAKSIHAAISNLSSIMRDDGVLVMWEPTIHPDWFDTTFALIDGWQRFEIDGLRNSHPLLNVEQWRGVLEANRFDWLGAYPDSPGQSGVLGQHIIVASKRPAPRASWIRSRDPEGSSLTDDAATLDRLLYRLRWEPANVTESSGELSGNWLIFTDACGIGRDIAGQIEQRGGFWRVMIPDGHGEYPGDGQPLSVNPHDPDAILAALHSYYPLDKNAAINVIHSCSAIDEFGCGEIGITQIEQMFDLGCKSVITLVKALRRFRGAGYPCRLWVITRGAQQINADRDISSYPNASLWALGRVIAVEHPEIWGGMIDVDPGRVDDNGRLIIDAVLSAENHDHCAFVGEQRWIARLDRVAANESARIERVACRKDGTYLVTGGFGGVGRLVAEWLIDRGARRLILVGRSVLPPREDWSDMEQNSDRAARIDFIRRLEAKGVSVHWASLDISSKRDVQSYLETFSREGWPPIRGIVHCAGILEDVTIAETNFTQFDRVNRPKVYGSWNFHDLTRDRDIDLFILVSSASSYFPTPGAASYASANAFMEGLVHHRVKSGLPGLCIHLGVVDNVGLAGQANRTDKWRSRGVHSLSSEQVEQGLDYMLSRGIPVGAVASVDWHQFGTIIPSRSRHSVYRCLLKPSELGVTEGADDLAPVNDSQPVEPVDSSSGGVSPTPEVLLEKVSALLMLDKNDIQFDQPLSSMGFDSIMGVQLKNEIEQEFDVELTIDELANNSLTDIQRLICGNLTNSQG